MGSANLLTVYNIILIVHFFNFPFHFVMKYIESSYLHAILKTRTSRRKKNMKHIHLFLFLFLMAWVPLAAQEEAPYTLTPRTIQNTVFFRLSTADQLALLEKVKIVHEAPEGTILTDQQSAVNYNRTLSGRIIAGNLHTTTVWHINGMKKQNNTIVLMTAKNMDDVVMGLVLAPDYLVVVPALDPKKIKTFLKDRKNIPEHLRKPLRRPSLVINYDRCGERAEGTDVRVMSYNILARVWGGRKMQIEYRIPLIIEIIKKAAPDFIGLQEVDMYSLLKEELLHPYRIVKKPRNMCSILYNAQKYKYLTGDTGSFRDKPNGIRCLSWSLFEEISTGKKIIITNTHWDLNETQRIDNAKRMSRYLAELKEKYPGVPIICTGDYNTHVDKEALPVLLRETGLRDAVENAPITENKQVCSYFDPRYYRIPPTGGKHIDHILATDDMIPLSAKLIAGEIVFEASDHLPIIADFKRK